MQKVARNIKPNERATGKRATGKRATGKRATGKRATGKRDTGKRDTGKRALKKREYFHSLFINYLTYIFLQTYQPNFYLVQLSVIIYTLYFQIFSKCKSGLKLLLF